jgi:hypothetical protein
MVPGTFIEMMPGTIIAHGTLIAHFDDILGGSVVGCRFWVDDTCLYITSRGESFWGGNLFI